MLQLNNNESLIDATHDDGLTQVISCNGLVIATIS